MITWMQTHRKYLVPTIWISTIAFVGAGFVGWGAYDYGSNKQDTVAVVGDREVSVNELQSTYSKLFSYYNQIFGGKLTQEKASELHLQDIALEKLTNEALLLNYADELGITALDEEIINEYTSISAFQENGIFNKKKYENILRAQGIDKKLFEHELEKSVILKKMQAILKLPATPLEEESSFAATSLSDHLIIKKLTQTVDSITVDEAEVKKAWESSKNDYMSQISYELETIKVPAAEIEVDEDALKAFYDEKRYKFKDSDGKILPFEKAKEEVKKAVQLKKAKTAVLKKYLAFKKGEIKAQEELTVDAKSATFPFATLQDVKEGAFIKAIALSDAYMTARVKKINHPKPLAYEEARERVEAKLKQEKAMALLKEKAKSESLSLKDGEDIGYVSINEYEKIKALNPQIASQFLRYVFSKNEKNGYFITGNEAIVYHIKEQRLFDSEKFQREHNITTQKTTTLKSNVIESGLLQELKKKYKIQTFLKEG
jgi:peptidyl-prolyl cis-trans isomerase D